MQKFIYGSFDKGKNVKYQISDVSNGEYIFLIDGQLRVSDEDLFKRDAIGISDTTEFEIEMMEDSNFIVVDVPMN